MQPTKQLDVIRQLTRPTFTCQPPADIVGLDWNGLHRGAQFGEFWTAEGWDDSGRDADHLTVRKTVRHSLGRMKTFWQDHGVWPASTPPEAGLQVAYRGPSPGDLDSAACTDCGANVWTTRRGPFIAEYDTGAICGYCSYECYVPIGTGTRSKSSPANGAFTSHHPDTTRVFRAPGSGGAPVEGPRVGESQVSRHQNEPEGSGDAGPVDVPTTCAAAVGPAAVPEEIRSITRGLASEQPPTNPLDVLKAARWWYIHGQGGTDPVFQWAIEWTHHLATGRHGDVARFDAFLEYLVALGFAEEKAALR